MKKTLKAVLCLALAVLMLGTVAFAAGEPQAAGISGVTVAINDGAISVTVPDTLVATAGDQAVILVVKAKGVTPEMDTAAKVLAAATAENNPAVTYEVGEGEILYIDQDAVATDGKTFTGTPSSLTTSLIVLGGGKGLNNDGAAQVIGAIKTFGVEVKGKVKSYNVANPVAINIYASTDTAHASSLFSGTIAANSPATADVQEFTVDSVSAGTYDVVVTKPGHLSYTVKGVVVGDTAIDLASNASKPYAIMNLYCSDMNGDNRSNSTDLGLFRTTYGKAIPSGTHPLTDCNGDNRSNSTDLGIFRSAYGKASISSNY